MKPRKYLNDSLSKLIRKEDNIIFIIPNRETYVALLMLNDDIPNDVTGKKEWWISKDVK